MRLFDSHCHLDDAQFDDDRHELIQALPQQGLVYCMTVGSDLASSQRSLELADQYDFLYAAAGVHPHEAIKISIDYLQKLEILLNHKKALAIGEIGLDYHYEFSPRSIQKALLEEQLDLAYEKKLPVILHVRDAHGDMIELMNKRRGKLPKGVLHCFSGSAQSAIEYINLGFHVSFAGPLTFKNAGKLLLAAQAVPLDRLLIETDSPYLTPEPLRGKRNDPSKIRYICQKLGSLRNMTDEEMADITCNNAMNLFGIKTR